MDDMDDMMALMANDANAGDMMGDAAQPAEEEKEFDPDNCCGKWESCVTPEYEDPRMVWTMDDLV